MNRALVFHSILMLVLACLLLTACEQKRDPAHEVVRTLEQRERGLNLQDMDMYLGAISSGYAGSTTAYEEIVARAEDLFERIDTIQYSSYERSLYSEEHGRIRAVQRFTMELTSDGRTRSVSGHEQLFLVPEDDRYLIVDGL